MERRQGTLISLPLFMSVATILTLWKKMVRVSYSLVRVKEWLHWMFIPSTKCSPSLNCASNQESLSTNIQNWSQSQSWQVGRIPGDKLNRKMNACIFAFVYKTIFFLTTNMLYLVTQSQINFWIPDLTFCHPGVKKPSMTICRFVL